MSNIQIGSLTDNYLNIDFTGQTDPSDRYFFSPAIMGKTHISAAGFSGPIKVEVQDSEGKIIKSIVTSDTSTSTFIIDNLGAADYSVNVSPIAGDTQYQISITPDGKVNPLTKMNIEYGYFITDQNGKVGFDFLHDGGLYQGEIAIFSLDGMENFIPGSQEFIKEAASRARSNSELGHIVISDATEGAIPELSGGLGEEDFNQGQYQGVKTFAMTPGKAFAVMLVPNGAVEDVFNNPDITGEKRPLFSLSSSNPNDAWLYGQIADVTGDGKAFAIEDQRADGTSDKDYNDFIFNVTGATGKAVWVKNLIDSAKDWTNTETGKKLIKYVKSKLSVPEPPVPPIPVPSPPQNLQFDLQSTYATGEAIEFTSGKVYDANGVSDIARVELSQRKEGGEWTQIEDVTKFIADSEGLANFSYSLPALAAGTYELKAIAYDKESATSNTVIKTFTVKEAVTLPVNQPPQNLQFDIQTAYTVGEAISLTAAKVYDPDGVTNLQKVELYQRKEGGEWAKLNDAASFVADSQGWATFNYSLSNLESGSYELKAIAYDKEGATSNTVVKTFTVKEAIVQPPANKSPEYLQFSVPTTVKPNEAIQITDGKIFDANGTSDLARVEFWLQKEGGEWTKVDDVTNFTPDSLDNNLATFDAELKGLEAGKYQLKAIAYDKSGAASNEILSNFLVNTPPSDLQFRIYPLYTNGEKLSFKYGKVSDAEGVSDIDRVDFWLQKEGGEKIEITNDVREFESDDEGIGRFDFSYDLSQLQPGRYQLSGIAYDKNGASSEIETENFALITNPGEIGLSDDVRLAIVGAANIDSYPPEALAEVKEWVVWLTPGQSSQELAASVGAIDEGETGNIPNTFIWKFPAGMDVKKVADQLTTISGVEYAYPEVPVRLKLLYEPKETLYKQYQWNLDKANLPAAWDIINPATSEIVRGKGVTLAIVDDGLQYNHLEFTGRYNPILSWDFSDNDNDPSPTSKVSFDADISKPTVNEFSTINFSLPVNLTGMVTGVNTSFDFSQSLPPNLPRLEELQVSLYSPDPSEFSLFYGSGSRGVRVQWPGREDLKFSQKDEIKLSGNSSQIFNLTKFNGSYAGGNWKLEITNPDPDEYDEQEMQQLSQELLKRWTLQIKTANPHGTAVGGIGGASENRKGIMGVAPEVDLAVLRIMGNTDPFDYKVDLMGKQLANALYDPNRNQSIDILNSSWGPEYMRRQPLALQALENGVTQGRNGLGNNYVFAGGNEGNFYGNVNYNSFASSLSSIAVAAINKAGNRATYSTPGSAIFISASSDSGDPNNLQGITTTAIYEKGSPYGNDFGGTSAAAPVVSGVIALMLEVNPNLTTRDVQQILAKTAKRNDPDGRDTAGNPRWVQNKAGYWVSYDYGFGAIDAEAAVKAAINWTPVGKQVSVTSDLLDVMKPIPDGNATGIEAKITIDKNIIVEKANVILDSDHPDWGDLTVKLISPNGTESVLSNTIHEIPNSNNSDKIKPDYNEWRFTSIRNWGELSKGEWKLQVIDKNGNKLTGNWDKWKLDLYGLELDESPNVVTNTKDSGPGSLRAVLEWANSNPGKDTVIFKIPPTDPGYNISTNSFTIQPLSELPRIRDSVIIDGTTQPGFSDRPVIEIDGSKAGRVDGLYISAGDSTVKGLTINRFAIDGIRLTGQKGNNIIQGNFLGTDVTGTKDFGNLFSGLSVWTPNNIIGGKTAESRNIMSGNDSLGIFVRDLNANNNLIEGNYIGPDITGNQYLGNTNGGIAIFNAPNNTIGGTDIEAGNLIIGNGKNGIFVSSSGATGNAILSNSIWLNNLKGIDLEYDGLTLNDVGDSDTGANNLQNFPELTSAISSGGNTTIKGKINSTPNTTFIVQFFSNQSTDASGYGEGEKFLGFQNVTTDSSGNATVAINLPLAVPVGQFITATATDPNNNTSEFSKGIAIKPQPTELFSDINANLEGVYFSSVASGDYDNDGDIDILVTGINGQNSVAKIYRNDNGKFTDINAGLQGVSSSSVDLGDYDRDGDIDILLTGLDEASFNLFSKVYRNDNGKFTDINAKLQGLSDSSATWLDYDKDGDLDILLTGSAFAGGITKLYRNDSGSFTDTLANLQGVFDGSVDAGDYDKDGDIDILLTGNTGSSISGISKVYRNDNGSFTDIGASLTGVSSSDAAWGDYDNDGDLDILLTGRVNSASPVSKIYRNDSGNFTDINANLQAVGDSSVSWGDYDKDGDLDILLSGATPSGFSSKIYRNDGGIFTDINANLQGVYLSSVNWADYNNDGALDILLSGNPNGTSSGITKVYRNNL